MMTLSPQVHAQSHHSIIFRWSTSLWFWVDTLVRKLQAVAPLAQSEEARCACTVCGAMSSGHLLWSSV